MLTSSLVLVPSFSATARLPASKALEVQSAIVSGEYIGLHSQYYMNMHSLSSSLLSLVTTFSSNGVAKCYNANITSEQ